MKRILRKRIRGVTAFELGLALAVTLGPMMVPALNDTHRGFFEITRAHAQEPAAARPGAGENAALADAERLVTIGSSVSEIVSALGAGDRIAGRDSTSMYPDTVNALPDIGYMRQLAPEGILSVEPDGIIAIEGSGPPATIDVLEKARVPFITVPEDYTAEGVVEKIETIGALIGAEDAAAKLAADVRSDFETLRTASEARENPKSVLFILSMQGGAIMAAGSGTAANGIIELAGAENALSGFSGYKPVSDEAVSDAAPDAILMMDRSGDHAADNSQILAHPALATTPAAQAGAIFRMDGGYLLGFGPRTADAAQELATALYSETAHTD